MSTAVDAKERLAQLERLVPRYERLNHAGRGLDGGAVAYALGSAR